MSTVKKVIERMNAPARSVATSAAPASGDPAAPVGPTAEDVERYRRKVAELEAALAKATRDKDDAQKRAEAVATERDAERVRAAVVKAAGAANAVDPDEIADLIGSKFKLVDGKIVHADDPAKDPAAFVGEYLASKPHHVRAQVAGGSGAAPVPKPAPGAPAPKQYSNDVSGLNASFHDRLRAAAGAGTPPGSTAAPNGTPRA